MNDQTFVTVVGHVDGTAHEVMSGWAFDPGHPNERVKLELVHEGQPICTFEADRFRDDLLEAGMGDGCHGFSFRLPIEVFTAPLVSLRIRATPSGVDLVGSPLQLRNHRMLLDAETLQLFSDGIRSSARSAQASDDLRMLSAWLIEHFDVVYQRQAALSASALARVNQFNEIVRQNCTLSDLLRQAADAVVATYAPLTLAHVEDPLVTVVIPAFGQFAYTYQCLKSIVANLPVASFEVILVDDCSNDETIYAGLILSDGIRIFRNAQNLGFLQSSMVGARSARGKYLLFLNNDTEVTAGWLDSLLRTFEIDRSIGVVGSKLLYPDGKLQEAGGIVWRQGTGWNWGRGEDASDPKYCYMRDTDYVSGAALMIRQTVFEEVGGFSPEFAPGYYEDTDLCFKVRATGRRVVVQPGSRVIHYEGTTGGTDIDGRGMKRHQRTNQRTFLEKWFDTLQSHHMGDLDPQAAVDRTVRQRVLFIDDTVPTPDRDAGSNAALEHMKSLQRIGYKVSFVGADNMASIAPYTPGLEQIGIQNYYAPYFWSVEEIFRREKAFDLFYIHRVANFVKYAPMIRQRFPDVNVVFNVADLHHLRLEREAAVKDCPEIADRAEKTKFVELAAVKEADRVVVHSAFEQSLLSERAPGANIHVLPWVLRPRRPAQPFSRRNGFAFVGGYNHTPNVDAVIWLVNEVMPLVHARDPGITCTLIGSDMPDVVRKLAGSGVTVVGHVPDLAPVLDTLRLTVAPLRYGAGLKGKVLTSLAAGLPCVATSCAVEGMLLPKALQVAVADTPQEFANCILRIHSDEKLNTRLADVGISFIEARCSESAIDTLMRAVVAPKASADSS